MTNYNERLDELITSCDFEPETPYSRICKWCGKAKGTSIHTLKIAITSLIKELVAEAKPEEMDSFYEKPIVDEFEQNLLKALEEV